MALFQQNANVTPGIDAAKESMHEDPTWGSWDINRTYVVGTHLSATSRDAGNSPTTILRPGLLMGYDATNQVALPITDLTLVSQDIWGILLYSETFKYAADVNKWFGYVITGGAQIRMKTIVASAAANSPGDLVGNATIEAALDALGFQRDNLKDGLSYA